MPNKFDSTEFDTKLGTDDEQKFQKWKAQYAPNDDGSDYDLRGAFQSGITPDAERGHFPDTFKKPNHPTFSTESKWNGFKDSSGQVYLGGKWGEDKGKTNFLASPTNLQFHNDLQDYFKRVEPDSNLILPKAEPNPIQDVISPVYNSKRS